jgi:hypothetical protein
MTTVTVQDQPAEVEQLDVDALRKATIRHLLDLADKYNLPWPADTKVADYRPHGGNLYLALDLVDDDAASVSGWAAALGMTVDLDEGYEGAVEPYVLRKATGKTLGWTHVRITTHLHMARGLPEQGPRPVAPLVAQAAALAAEAAEVVAAVLAPPTWSVGDTIDSDVFKVHDCDGDVAIRVGNLWVHPGFGPEGMESSESDLLEQYGPVTAVDELTAEEWEAVRLGAEALTPAEVADWLADTSAPPRSWSAGQKIDADVDEVTDSCPRLPDGVWRRSAGGYYWQWHSPTGTPGALESEAYMLTRFGPCTEVVAAVSA